MRKLILLALALLVSTLAFASTGSCEDKEAKEILRRAIDAAGGERALGRLKSPMMWMERGTFHGMGDGIPFVRQYAAKWPNWYRQEIEGVFTITVSGDKAWVSSAGGVQKLVDARLEEVQRQTRVSWAERLFPLTDDAYDLGKIDGIEIEGRSTVGIQASLADHRDVSFFFDAETYLVAKIETMVISPQHGPEPVLSETFFKEHKSFGGVRMRSKFKQVVDKKLFVEAETIDYKMGATLDPQHFDEPQ